MPSLSDLSRRWPALAAVALAAAVSACAGESFSLSQINVPKFDVTPLETNRTLAAAGPLGPVTAEQLVGADGSCAAPPGGTATGVGLGMSECDVVGRIGAPQNVELGMNERQQRTAVLTYGGVNRPGIYRFVGGRLAVIEGTPESPAPPKTVKKTKKKKQATTPQQ